MSLADLADRHLTTGQADNLALRWRSRDGRKRDFSFKDLAALSDRLAQRLLRLGLQPGEAVGVMTGRHPETVLAALAIWKAGGIYCPLFIDLGPDPLLARLRVARTGLLLVGEEAYAASVAPVRASLGFVRHILVLGDKTPPDCHSLSAMMAVEAEEIAVLPVPSGAGILHFTSGTTAPVSQGGGEPRAIQHDHLVLPRLVASGVEAFGLRPGDRLWCTGDPGWVVHCCFGIVVPLAIGASILLDEAPPTPTRCVAMFEDEQIDIWYTTPTIIRGLMGAGAVMVRSACRGRLRLAASVGEPLSADAVAWGESALGVPLRDSWWQTETGGIVLAHTPSTAPVAGSMGKALTGVTVKLVERRDDGLHCLPEDGASIGEIALRCADLAPWRALGGEQGAPPEDIDGWHLTHDIARRDTDGNFWFLGRADEVINIAGRMVGPFEVEAVLMGHPAVAEVGVVGAPDPSLHEHIVAFVGLNPGFDPVRALRDELYAYAVEHLGSILAPGDIRFEQCLPRTSSGKIIRRRLKERLG